MFTKNPYALLSEDSVPSAVPVKKAVPIPTPVKKVNDERKDQGARRTNDQGPRRDQRNNTRGRGRGGRVSAPRTFNDANNEDFTGGNPAEVRPDQDSRQHGNDRPRRPRGENHRGRAYDRRSGTGRFDGEKKEVAGASWGDAVESAGVTEGQSAEEALVSAENAGAENGDVIASEPIKSVEEDNTKSFEEYQKELKAKKNALKAKPVRRANEGVDESAWKSAQVLVKPEVDDADELAVLLQGSKKPTAQKKKERKEKQTVDIEVKFTQEPARRGGDDRRGGRGFRGGRGGNNTRNTGFRTNDKSPVNINDTNAFPSLA